jgi:hypothetical protein
MLVNIYKNWPNDAWVGTMSMEDLMEMDFIKKFVGFLGILWYLEKLTMYNTRSVTIFSTI